MLFKRNVMKTKTGLFPMLSALCAAAAAVLISIMSAGNSDAASVERKNDMKTDKEGHVLVELWKKYNNARLADRPQKESEILDKIIKESLEEGLCWDFYDASYKWYHSEVSRNWKQREKSLDRIAADAEQMGNTVVTYRLIRSGLIDSVIDSKWFAGNVQGNADALKQACNRTFYRNDSALAGSHGYAPFITDLISNDYEYLLWSISRYSRYSSYSQEDNVREAAEQALKEYIGDVYPVGAFLEYTEVLNGVGGPWIEETDDDLENHGESLTARLEKRESALESFAAKYEGKAISLYANEQMLLDRKQILDMGQRGIDGLQAPQSSDYKKLRKDCEDFIRLQKSFRGKEKAVADCLTSVRNLAEELDSRSVWLHTEGYEISVVFRNVDKATLELRHDDEDGELVHSAVISNDRKSYYLLDTVKYQLPPTPDGDYMLVCRYGKEMSSLSYPVFSLSIAGRTVKDSGCGIYIAWQDSGKPVEKADIEILSKGKVVKTVKDYDFEGFTPVQEILDETAAEHEGALEIRCSTVDGAGLYRRSPELFLSGSAFITPASKDSDSQVPERKTDAGIYKDRGAFNPGDSVQFKVVLYSHSDGNDYAVESDKEIKVWLTGPDGKTVSETTMKTNAFGSASGSFELPEGLKGGTYFISVNVPGQEEYLNRSPLTVDEFVLPAYTMEFDNDRAVWFAGDTVVVKGRLTSYSGHPVSSAKLEYSVESYASGIKPVHGEMKAGDDGSFEIRFRAGVPTGGTDRTYFCYPTVKATDLTGETYEWSVSPVYVNPQMHLSTHLSNGAEGNVEMMPGIADDGVELMSCDSARLRFNLLSSMPECPVEYEVTRSGEHVLSGSVMTGEEFVIDLSGRPSGIYSIKAKAVYVHPDGRRLEGKDEMSLLKTSASETSMDYGVESFFRKIDDGRVAALVGVGDGEQWFVMEIHDAAGRLLHSEIFRMDGKNGADDSVRLVCHEYDDSWTDAVSMVLFGFRNGEVRSDSFTYRRPVRTTMEMPLAFTRFTDRTLPGTRLEFCLQTSPDAECLVSVYDKSTDNIRGNSWSEIRFREATPAAVRVRSETGRIGGDSYYAGGDFQLFGASADAVAATPMLRSKSVTAENAMDTAARAIVREQFDNTLAFLPHIYPDNGGNMEFNVDVTDKLSTYYVSVFAHDRRMRNSVLRKEMTVSLPVKVSVAEPKFLYAGDTYRLRASVSNSSDSPLSGHLLLYVYGTTDHLHSDPIKVMTYPLTVGAGSAAPGEFAVDVPAGSDTLGFKIVYTADIADVSVSDAMFVSIPVMEPVQTLTEAHSAVLAAGMDRDSLKKALAAEFTGISRTGAEYSEIRLMDMLTESVPGKCEPKAKDVLSLSEAYYMNLLASSDPDEGALLEDILACRNHDGGFGWFEGFSSSPVITAVVLERFAALMDRGLCSVDLSDAVNYLDSLQFMEDRPSWYGGISLPQYLYLRSMYPDVPFTVAAGKKQLKEFAGQVRDYLLPADGRGLDDNILGKARRAATLLSLSSPKSETLAISLGLKKRDIRKLASSADADIVSLTEYAVQHPSGGVYFPNAVMPFRGLLESEAYAHSLLCDLMWRYSGGSHGPGGNSPETPLAQKASDIAEGVRLWLMLQKETQNWESDPAYLNAVSSVLDGSESLKSSVIAVMTKNYMKPFGEIEASGNEMSIIRQWYKVVSGITEEEADSLYSAHANACEATEGAMIKPVKTGQNTWMFPVSEGDTLTTGDKLVAEYRIWSQENRSFVQMVSPYYASMRPANQLSGRTGGWFRPLLLSGAGISKFSFTPCGYREVKSDRTIYYFDVCPEEKTIFTEEFYVTQSGIFSSPAVTVECLYSPHYRANGAAETRMVSE